MERGRHKKSKSASGIEDIRRSQKQKAVPRLSSDSRYFIDGSNKDDVFMFGLGQSSTGRATATPMKKLLAEEMSKDVKSKRRSPSVIARLMGLEGLPSPRHVEIKQKRSSDSYLPKNVSVNIQRGRQLYDGHSNRRSSLEQQEFKDVYEDLEAPHVKRRCSSRWGPSSMLTKREMALIEQKFVDAKRLSTDKALQDSKELDEALEMLDSNKDLLLEFLQQRDSSFVKHMHDLFVDSSSSHSSHIAVLKPSNPVKYEGNSRTWNSERNTSSKHCINSQLKRKDGLLLESHNRHRARVFHDPFKVQLEEQNDEDILPTRIVVLKPNLGKMRNASVSGSSPDSSDALSNSKKTKQYPSTGDAEIIPLTRNDSSRNIGFSKSISREAREIARKIATRMTDSCDENADTKSVVFRGYAGDESSYDASESDSDNELDVLKLFPRKSVGDSKLRRYPSALTESPVNREAKHRLSERWKMTQRYQDLEMVGDGGTLGEMLARPDREARPKQLNANMSHGRASNSNGSNKGTGKWDCPLGISSKDGWKHETNRNLSRSRSLPPSIVGRSNGRSTYHDKLAEDKHLTCGDPTHRGKSKVVSESLSHREDLSSRDSKSRSKRPLHHEHIFFSETGSFSNANFEIQMEANIKDLSKQQPMFHMAAKDDTCRSPDLDVMMITECGSTTLSPKFCEILPVESFSFPVNDKSAADNDDISSPQELLKVPPEQGSPSLQSFGGDRDTSESSKEADHPSPVSVLDVPFTEDTSTSSESFERVNAELHELRTQLQLLKMESGNYSEASTLIPIEEEVPQFSQNVAEGWETSYALDVLIESGLDESGFDIFDSNWYSPDCPLDPKLFDNLENKYSNETTGMRSERRLLFDRINLALLEIFGEQVVLFPWVKPNLGGFSCTRLKEGIAFVLQKTINQERLEGKISERVLDREMEWSDYKGVINDIGNEIEKLLIDDMITEVLCN